MPDFSRMPYFADLFGAPQLADQINNSYMNEARLQSQLIQNERFGTMNEQMRQQIEAQKVMAEALRSNPEDPMGALKAAAMASGDPRALINIQNQERQEKRFDLQSKEQQFKRLVESGASLEAEDFYRQHLEPYYGQGSADIFKRKPNLRIDGGSGEVYDANDLQVGQRFERREPRSQRDRLKIMYTPDGQTRFVDMDDPRARAEAEAGGWKASSPKEMSPTDLIILNAMAKSDPNNPYIIEQMEKLNKSATPQGTPTPTPTPEPPRTLPIPPSLRR